MFKKGQKVVSILTGAGYETAALRVIAQVSKGRVRCEESDTWYDRKTGREMENSGMGFSSRLVCLEGG